MPDAINQLSETLIRVVVGCVKRSETHQSRSALVRMWGRLALIVLSSYDLNRNSRIRGVLRCRYTDECFPLLQFHPVKMRQRPRAPVFRIMSGRHMPMKRGPRPVFNSRDIAMFDGIEMDVIEMPFKI